MTLPRNDRTGMAYQHIMGGMHPEGNHPRGK